MQFTVENSALSKALASVRSCLPRMTTIPLLQHVVLEARSGSVSLRAGAFDREAEATVVAQVGVDGIAAVPGEILVGLASHLPSGGQCALELVGDRVVVLSGSVRFELRALPANDFPNRKSFDGSELIFAMPAAALRELLVRVDYATLVGSPKAYHAGVYLHVAKKKLIAVASDDHRFALHSTDAPKGLEAMPGVIIPAEAVSVLADALRRAGDEKVELSISESLLEIRLAGLRIATLLVGATFPDYTRVVPKPNGAGVVVRSGALLEAAERLSVVYLKNKLGERVPLLQLKRKDGALELRAGFKGCEVGSEEIDAETNGVDGLDCSVNVAYLMDALKAWPDDAHLSVQQTQKGGAVLLWAREHPGMLHLVMPSSN